MTNILKKIIGGISLGLIISVAAFWWYEWRPHEIRKDCNAAALQASDYRLAYESCLHRSGLEK